jgi:hypothetical protein
MEFFIVELLLLSSAGSLLLMFVGMLDPGVDARIRDLSQFALRGPNAQKPSVQQNAEQDVRRFDEAA